MRVFWPTAWNLLLQKVEYRPYSPENPVFQNFPNEFLGKKIKSSTSANILKMLVLSPAFNVGITATRWRYIESVIPLLLVIMKHFTTLHTWRGDFNAPAKIICYEDNEYVKEFKSKSYRTSCCSPVVPGFSLGLNFCLEKSQST